MVRHPAGARVERWGGPWIQPVDSLTLFYQIGIFILVLWSHLAWEEKFRLLGIHVFVCLLLLVFLWNVQGFTHPVARFFREGYPLMIMLFFYREIGRLVHGYFDWTLDEWLLRVDNGLGGIGTSIWNFQQFYPPSRLLNEIFSVGYAFYFVLLLASALILYFRAPLSKFRTFLFSLCLTYYLHYILFIFLPASSPRFFMPGLRESLKGYWVSDWLQSAVENNAFPGGSFPSSHIAAAVICFHVFPFLGKWRFATISLMVLMLLGTIYGRYHYFVDVVAGLGVGLCCYYLAPLIEKHWPFIFDEEGIVRERARQAVN